MNENILKKKQKQGKTHLLVLPDYSCKETTCGRKVSNKMWVTTHRDMVTCKNCLRILNG